MSLIHLARQGFITKSALPNVTRQRGTTTGTANLMLYGAGKDHSIGTNTTFTDSSSNNFTVTRNGDTIQATNNPFTGSVYFDGTDDYLSVANNTALQPGTGTFTIECWIYRGVAGAAHTIYAKGGTSTGFVFQITSSNTLRFTDTTTNIDSTGTIPALTWTHVAVARSGTGSNQTKLFINGVVDGQGTVATDFNQTEEVRIGTDRSAASDFNGHISCLRFVKGTAVYTANFTVPTSPLTAITNTQLLLLTAQQAPFRDSSSNNFTVTANGNAAGSGLEPFPVNYAGSGYFDGTGDYLSVANNVAFDFGSGDLTIEQWVYPTSLGAERIISSQWFGGTISQTAWTIDFQATNKIRVLIGSGSSTQVTINSTSTFSANNWYHVAVVRSGTTITLYVNGVNEGSVTLSGVVNNISYPVYIGALNNGGSLTSPFIGYISNFRILKGTAQYTAAFTPPAAPLTAVTNTQLLLLTNNVGPFVDTSANGFPVLRNGDTVQTGFSPFTGQPSAGSAYFDGTGDYLTSSLTSIGNFGTGDFTVECWIYASSTATLNIIDFRGSAGTGDGFRLAFGSTAGGTANKVIAGWGTSDQVLVATNIANTGQWYHVAVTRSGTTARLFIDGVQNSSATNSVSIPDSGLIVASYRGTTAYYQGYISNLRIVKGTALYTSNFTPATAPLPAVPNTSLLLNTDNYTIANSTPTYLPVTVNGNTTISTAQYPTGMNRSIAFDGNSDYVQVPNDAAIADFGTGDFTIELFINITSVDSIDSSSNRGATAITTTVGFSGNGWNIELGGNASGVPNSINFNSRQGASQIGINANVTMSKTVWYHIAVARSGTVTTIYLDGVSVGSATLSNQTISSTQPIWIGGQNISGYQHWVNGYISNVRIVKGSALYTANFTPPAAPLPLSVTVPAFVTNNIYGVYQLA